MTSTINLLKSLNFMHFGAGILLIVLVVIILSYKRVSPSQMIVKWNRFFKNKTIYAVRGRGVWVIPFIERYVILENTPISLDFSIERITSNQGLDLNLQVQAAVIIKDEQASLDRAATRLAGWPIDYVKRLTQSLLESELRKAVSHSDVKTIVFDRVTFVENIISSLNLRLEEYGLEMLFIDIKAINDDQGYIERFAKTASDQFIYDATSQGAHQTAEVAKKTAFIEAERDRLCAQEKAAALIALRKAEAEAEEILLCAKAEGYDRLIKACGGDAEKAAKFLMIEKMEEIARIYAGAMKDIKIDKIMVWDGGLERGESSTTSFLNSLAKVLPPLHELMEMGGIQLPETLGKKQAVEHPNIEKPVDLLKGVVNNPAIKGKIEEIQGKVAETVAHSVDKGKESVTEPA